MRFAKLFLGILAVAVALAFFAADAEAYYYSDYYAPYYGAYFYYPYYGSYYGYGYGYYPYYGYGPYYGYSASLGPYQLDRVLTNVEDADMVGFSRGQIQMTYDFVGRNANRYTDYWPIR